MTPRRPTCPRCQLPLPGCLCRWITPTANATPLLVLQHPLEVAQAKGSVRLLRFSLQRCRCEVGERFDPQTLAGWLGDIASCRLLYPAGPGEAVAVPPPAAQLVLLDGTWRKTRKLLHANPLLQQLLRWALPSPPPSRYRIRRAQQPHQRSTLEAACAALALLEGDAARYEPLLTAFDGWVDQFASRA
jgi:DTW domain-containing protein YfiP